MMQSWVMFSHPSIKPSGAQLYPFSFPFTACIMQKQNTFQRRPGLLHPTPSQEKDRKQGTVQ
jgi:hypothetical protein